MASIRFHSVREVTNQLQSAAAQDMKFMSARHEAAVPASPPDVRYWGQTRRDAGVPRSRSLTHFGPRRSDFCCDAQHLRFDVLGFVLGLLGRLMRRREFITLLGGAATAWPLAARAQQPDRMRLVGVLMAFAESDSTAQSWLAAFRAALAQLGWTEGSNLRIELRWSAVDPDKIRTFAKELIDLRPDAIFGQSTPA